MSFCPRLLSRATVDWRHRPLPQSLTCQPVTVVIAPTLRQHLPICRIPRKRTSAIGSLWGLNCCCPGAEGRKREKRRAFTSVRVSTYKFSLKCLFHQFFIILNIRIQIISTPEMLLYVPAVTTSLPPHFTERACPFTDSEFLISN